MENTVWHSAVMRNYRIGDRLGLADKWFGRDWDQEDKTTRVAGDFHIWKLGARKDGFRPDRSPRIGPRGFGRHKSEDQWDAWRNAEDDDIAVAAAAVAGPPDVWCDPKLHLSLFFSDPLHAAIGAAAIGTAFEFRRCRLV